MEVSGLTPRVAGVPADDPFSEELGDPTFGLDLRRMVAIARRNIFWILGIVAFCVLAGLVFTMLSVPSYTATATVMIEQQAEEIIEGGDTAPTPAYQDAGRFLQSEIAVIRSRDLAKRVVEAESLSGDPRFFAGMRAQMPGEGDVTGVYKRVGGLEALRRDIAVSLLQEHLKVVLPAESRVAELRMDSADPVLAARLANAIASAAVQGNLNRKFESSSYARHYLTQQLSEARQRLEDSERALNQYSRAAGLIRVPGQGQNADQENTLSITNDTLVQVNLAASQATAERISAQNKWENVARMPVLSVPQVLANPAAQDLIRQRSAAQAALSQELAIHLDDHPTVEALRAQVQQIDSQLQSLGESIKRSVQLDYVTARDKEASLKNQVGALQSYALSEQDRSVQYNVLKRVAETNRSLYDTLLKRFNELNAAAGAVSNNISLVDEATPPRSPTSPNLVLNILLAFLTGVVLSAAFVVLREHLDDVIRTPEDVEAKLGLPLLGLIPAGSDDEITALREDSKSGVGEAYHSLVANLRYSTISGLPRSLVVTSAQSAEGKTTTAMAIAAHLARLGNRVLLIDADLRRPTLHRTVGAPGQHGLTDVLTGQAQFGDVILESDRPNLFLMTALPIPPDPSIILGSPRLGEIVEEAKARFDVVIFDSPPMLGLSDTPNLTAEADATILVVDASQGHRGAVRSALRRLNLIHANILGAVLTKFDPRAMGGDYSYYGYQYYRYDSESS